MHQTFLRACLLLVLGAPLVAQADTGADIAALRQEISTIRAAYEARLLALEERLKVAESRPNTAPVAAATPTPAAPPSVAPATAPAAGANAFNPAISLILSGLYSRTSQDPARYAITGLQLARGAEVGPGTRGFSLAESEIGIAANVDPWWRGAINLSLHPDDTVSVEEAYVQTTALGNGLSLKAGRFLSGVGYLNAKHAHTWDFVDNPLAYQALLGTQYADDGVQLTWLAPSDHFIELGLELGRGRGFPGGDNSRNGAGMTALSAHTGGDLGDSHSWRTGLSVLNARANDQLLVGRATNGDPVDSAFSGRTRVWVADAVWKWAPNGNATRTNFTLQGEYLRSTREGSLIYDPTLVASEGAYRAVQSGWYLQGVYQFMPAWRVGLRTEQLDAGKPDYGANGGLYALSNTKPRKNSLMVDFSPSEFSRLRLQLARDRSQQGGSDNQLFLQYQMSLGAHGAHAY